MKSELAELPATKGKKSLCWADAEIIKCIQGHIKSMQTCKAVKLPVKWFHCVFAIF